ncbi:MAG: hypothetical protein LM576_00615 [Thermofilum sp.]|nr:hypothetical protein [Thermofilum sp.]
MPMLNKALTAIALVLLLAVVTAPVALVLAAVYGVQVSYWQYVWVEIQTVEENGPPAGFVNVVAFELADGGPRLIFEGRTDAMGFYRFNMKFLKKLIAQLEDGTKIYAPINLWVIASREDGLLGTLTQPLNITAMKQPSDTVRLKVQVRKIAQDKAEGSAATASGCALPVPYLEESWAWTSVLQFSTWDNISAKFYYPIGVQIMVQSKERYWSGTTCSYLTGWSDAGVTFVTLDHGIGAADWLRGRTLYTMKFYFKYYFVRTYTNIPGMLVEKIYAVDTYPDPVDCYLITQSWDGRLPGWSYFATVDQNIERYIAISGGAAPSYTFSVGVSVTFTGVGVSVSLGVGKAPNPTGALTIRAGTWLPGYKVRVESNDGTFVVTRCNWISP